MTEKNQSNYASKNIQIRPELWDKVNLQAAKETLESGGKVYLRDVLEKALEKYLKEEGK